MKRTLLGVTLATVAALSAASGPAWAEEFNVSATGRCVYRDSRTGAVTPIAGAYVELRDQDLGSPVELDVVGPTVLDLSLNDVCARGTTDADGRFSLSGRCGDWGLFGKEKPDLYVRCATSAGLGKVVKNSFPWSLYNTTTSPRSDSAAALSAGDVVVHESASKAFTQLLNAYTKDRAMIGQSLVPVTAFFPGGREVTIADTGESYFASYATGIFMSISQQVIDDNKVSTIPHEYGHTLQFQAFLKEWSSFQSVLNLLRAGWESIQHATGAGHTYSTKSNPVMAFAEGFAEFNAGAVLGATKGLPDCATWKEIGATEADRIQVEGNVACRLYRLFSKWGYQDIFGSIARAKAVRYDHFISEYKKLHPTADSVAVPAAVSPVAVVAAARTLRVAPLAARAALTRPAIAVSASYLKGRTLTPRVARTIQQADGPQCDAVREAVKTQADFARASCPKLKSERDRARCEAKRKVLAEGVSKLTSFCAQLQTSVPNLVRIAPTGYFHTLLRKGGLSVVKPAVLPSAGAAPRAP